MAARLSELEAEIARGGTGPRVLDELREARELAAGLERYVGRCTTPESEQLAELDRLTQAHDWSAADSPLEPEMLSGHVEGQLLKFLVSMSRARRVLEIGMFTGYSALAMAEALPSDGELVACEIDERAAALARECFDRSPDGAKIEIRLAPALETLEGLTAEGQAFDLIFVDADKSGYLGYVDRVLEGDLLAPGGSIAVDNTLMQGLPYGPGEPTPNGDAIAAFNEAIAADRRVEQVLLPLRDGLTLVRRA